MLDRALQEAGIDRSRVYVTNAVKHFKFVPRGKIRLHQKPNTPEIKACRQWCERELAVIKPDLVVAMGATAAQSVFGKITPINKYRGRLIDLDEATKALVTVHPSYLLRLPDEDAKAREYERFVEDLKIVAQHQKKSRGMIAAVPAMCVPPSARSKGDSQACKRPILRGAQQRALRMTYFQTCVMSGRETESSLRGTRRQSNPGCIAIWIASLRSQ
jgi:uracil-DNA glycosylase family 4